ncbi:hypothetical protein GPECTOR_62g938 [Gonium pectorale]|uniref:C-type lectin domain-containing protein n=1 Tax=Gonium pectorale TaxID=33097 RepID=A0A150G4W3_GONPE|nr:hypothetical protein GPECTOR_62g938 [Gonium pectorale]|eukprot:KXZ44823.1 hypothetical protein GPECTOR_62g938 [Gonium pectorale]
MGVTVAPWLSGTFLAFYPLRSAPGDAALTCGSAGASLADGPTWAAALDAMRSGNLGGMLVGTTVTWFNRVWTFFKPRVALDAAAATCAVLAPAGRAAVAGPDDWYMISGALLEGSVPELYDAMSQALAAFGDNSGRPWNAWAAGGGGPGRGGCGAVRLDPGAIIVVNSTLQASCSQSANWTTGAAAALLPPSAADGAGGAGGVRLAVCFTVNGLPAGIRGMDHVMATLRPGTAAVGAFARRRRQRRLAEVEVATSDVSGAAMGADGGHGDGGGGGKSRSLLNHDYDYDSPPPAEDLAPALPSPPRAPPPPPGVLDGVAVAAQLGAGGRRFLMLRQSGTAGRCSAACFTAGMTLGASTVSGYSLAGAEYDASWAAVLQQAPPNPGLPDGGTALGAWVGPANATFAGRRPTPPAEDDGGGGSVVSCTSTALRYNDGSLRSTPCSSPGWCVCWN